MKNIEKNKHILCFLSSCKPTIRNAILAKSDKNLIATICEIVYNLLNNNLDINKTTLAKLHKYKNTFRKLVKKSNLKSKKEIIIQQGGFLQFLIPAAISGIATILSNVIPTLINNNKSPELDQQ